MRWVRYSLLTPLTEGCSANSNREWTVRQLKWEPGMQGTLSSLYLTCS
jgi:hypothetical protein